MIPDRPTVTVVARLARRIFSAAQAITVEPVAEGVSTYVYRLQRGSETFYLRVLPEVGDGFAPEALVHTLLRARGISVPAVIYWEHDNEEVQRSVMVTTAIPGSSVMQCTDEGTIRRVLVEAGRELAIINSIPVAGFGWIIRDKSTATPRQAEHPTYRAFVTEHRDSDLATLAELLDPHEGAVLRATLDHCDAWLDAEQGLLAHGDLDVTHIFQRDGQYTGIIDFGEIRGGDRWYDLGHFAVHDGEELPRVWVARLAGQQEGPDSERLHLRALPWLLEGYAQVVPLPTDCYQRIAFTSLLIAIHALAHRRRKYGPTFPAQPYLGAIRQAMALLQS
jgi:aminoglycoside phosphotransferase (APT) family kinase protein